MTSGGSVWAVVLHYRLWRETERCVGSLLESDYPELEILVVDNGSCDGSAEELRSRLPATVHLLSLAQNRFYAGGMNAGLAWALERGAAWVLALNNDTYVDPAMVSQLVAAARSQADVAIVAPLIYYAGAPEQIWNAGARRRRGWPFPHPVAPPGSSPTLGPEPLDVDYVTGCAMLLRHEALERVGSFDARYRMYYEDLDLCQRMREAGYRIQVVPAARMWHMVGSTAAREPSTNRYHRTRNRWRFYMQHTKGLVRLWTALLLLTQEGARILRFAVQGSPDLARSQWAALWDGLRGAESEPG